MQLAQNLAQNTSVLCVRQNDVPSLLCVRVTGNWLAVDKLKLLEFCWQAAIILQSKIENAWIEANRINKISVEFSELMVSEELLFFQLFYIILIIDFCRVGL